VRVVPSLDVVAAAVGPATWVATSAKPPRVTWTVADLAARLAAGTRPIVLMLGTGWGLAPQVLAAADEVLEPIHIGDYDHLSVRSAASIYIDRVWRAAVSG
jgi:tRNA (guanine37-N1)-methyltransferase